MDKQVLAPLIPLYTYSDYQEFSRWFCEPNITPSDRQKSIDMALKKGYFHQSELATDIRFLVSYFSLLTGRIHMPKSQLD